MFVQKKLAFILAALWLALFSLPGFAQDASDTRAQTGGAQTLEDILARQRGEVVNDQFRQDATGNPDLAAPIANQLGPLGGVSDPELWRAFRYGSADIISTDPSPAGNVVIQDGGMRWLEFRAGPLQFYGKYLLLVALVLLVILYVVVGKIRIEGEKTGEKVDRFTIMERLGHWMMAIPFILLAITGMFMLFGRGLFIPLFGKELYSTLVTGGKLVHNYIAWIFIAGLVLSFFRWALQNIPTKTDFIWIMKAGGMFSKGSHPSAGKFNAGEKMVFWAVVWFGGFISFTGLMLLFPYEIQVFSSVAGFLNDLGLAQMLGFGELNAVMTPQEEMQTANILHSVFSFLLMAIIFFHIYLGTVGMEGALEAMTKGKVDTQWAKEHHDLWYEDMVKENAEKTPAE